MPRYWNPMPAINLAITMFMEEHPQDALRVLHSIQEDYFAATEHDRMVDFAEDLKEEQEEQPAKHDPMQAWLVTNNIHHGKSYPERAECEAAVDELRNETGWDWTYISVEDETGDCWHHMPCICSGGSYVYLFPR